MHHSPPYSNWGGSGSFSGDYYLTPKNTEVRSKPPAEVRMIISAVQRRAQRLNKVRELPRVCMSRKWQYPCLSQVCPDGALVCSVHCQGGQTQELCSGVCVTTTLTGSFLPPAKDNLPDPPSPPTSTPLSALPSQTPPAHHALPPEHNTALLVSSPAF